MKEVHAKEMKVKVLFSTTVKQSIMPGSVLSVISSEGRIRLELQGNTQTLGETSQPEVTVPRPLLSPLIRVQPAQPPTETPSVPQAAPSAPVVTTGAQIVLKDSDRISRSHRRALEIVERHLRKAGSGGMTIAEIATAEYGLETGKEQKTRLAYAASRLQDFELVLLNGRKWYWMAT